MKKSLDQKSVELWFHIIIRCHPKWCNPGRAAPFGSPLKQGSFSTFHSYDNLTFKMQLLHITSAGFTSRGAAVTFDFFAAFFRKMKVITKTKILLYRRKALGSVPYGKSGPAYNYTTKIKN